MCRYRSGGTDVDFKRGLVRVAARAALDAGTGGPGGPQAAVLSSKATIAHYHEEARVAAGMYKRAPLLSSPADNEAPHTYLRQARIGAGATAYRNIASSTADGEEAVSHSHRGAPAIADPGALDRAACGHPAPACTSRLYWT